MKQHNFRHALDSWCYGLVNYWIGGGRRNPDLVTNPHLTMDLTDRAVQSATKIYQPTNTIQYNSIYRYFPFIFTSLVQFLGSSVREKGSASSTDLRLRVFQTHSQELAVVLLDVNRSQICICLNEREYSQKHNLFRKYVIQSVPGGMCQTSGECSLS